MAKKNNDTSERFKTRAAAFAWLQEQAAPVSERSFYSACDRGFPAVAPDKSLARWQVVEYLRRLESKQRQKTPGGFLVREDAETRKAVADARKAELQTAEMERQLDRKWILRERADEDLCVWTALTRDYIQHHVMDSIPAIIHAAGGKIDRAADVRQIIEDAVLAGCNDIANSGEIDVEIYFNETQGED